MADGRNTLQKIETDFVKKKKELFSNVIQGNQSASNESGSTDGGRRSQFQARSQMFENKKDMVVTEKETDRKNVSSPWKPPKPSIPPQTSAKPSLPVKPNLKPNTGITHSDPEKIPVAAPRKITRKTSYDSKEDVKISPVSSRPKIKSELVVLQKPSGNEKKARKLSEELNDFNRPSNDSSKNIVAARVKKISSEFSFEEKDDAGKIHKQSNPIIVRSKGPMPPKKPSPTREVIKKEQGEHREGNRGEIQSLMERKTKLFENMEKQDLMAAVANTKDRTVDDSKKHKSENFPTPKPRQSLAPSTNPNKDQFPTYAEINKGDKRRNETEKGDRLKNSYDGVVFLPTDKEIQDRELYNDSQKLSADMNKIHKPIPKPDIAPPPKPERTFQFDIYKANKEIQRKSEPNKEVLMSPYEDVPDFDFKRSSDSQIKKKNKVLVAEDNAYEEIEERPRVKSDIVKQQRPSLPIHNSALVHVREHNKKLSKESFVSDKSINNPNYDKQDECLPINVNRRFADTSLKRYKSDEYLYAEPYVDGFPRTTMRQKSTGIVPYQDPADVIKRESHVTQHGVVIDGEGYAVPETGNPSSSTLRPNANWKYKQRSGTIGPRQGGMVKKMKDARPVPEPRNQKFKKKMENIAKISQAYSVLRLNRVQEKDGTTTVTSTIQEDDNDSLVDMDEHKQRLNYMLTKKKQYSSRKKVEEATYGQLFEYGLVVGLEHIPEARDQFRPKTLLLYPQTAKQVIENVPLFCFPDADLITSNTTFKSDTFSFVLTNIDGTRSYGYCRRIILQEWSNSAEVLCIVSPLDCFGFYDKLLIELEKVRQEKSLQDVEKLLKRAYNKILPQPGREAWIQGEKREASKGNARGDKRRTLCLMRPTDSRTSNTDFGCLLKHLTVKNLLKVYASLLLERRVLFIAESLSTLSACIHALNCLLYPFTWQHTYIPVLPGPMVEVVCSPTPYIMGVLASSRTRLEEFETDMEEVLMVDLDTGQLMQTVGDESRVIPKKLQKALFQVLDDESGSTEQDDEVIFLAFMRLFVETCSHYGDYFSTQQNGEQIFQRDVFIKAVSSTSIRMFLEWFTETQMFEVFITTKLEQTIPVNDLFETTIMDYREEMANEAKTLKGGLITFRKKMKQFFTDSGGKIKKVFTRNVYV